MVECSRAGTSRPHPAWARVGSGGSVSVCVFVCVCVCPRTPGPLWFVVEFIEGGVRVLFDPYSCHTNTTMYPYVCSTFKYFRQFPLCFSLTTSHSKCCLRVGVANAPKRAWRRCTTCTTTFTIGKKTKTQRMSGLISKLGSPVQADLATQLQIQAPSASGKSGSANLRGRLRPCRSSV